MVTKTLVDRDIERGRRLLEELDREQFPIVAAFWLYNAQSDYWRLFLASPISDQQGPLVTYRIIREALQKLPEQDRVSVFDVTAANTKDVVVEAIRKFVRTGPGTAEIRLTQSSANGVYIDDALVYRTT